MHKLGKQQTGDGCIWLYIWLRRRKSVKGNEDEMTCTTLIETHIENAKDCLNDTYGHQLQVLTYESSLFDVSFSMSSWY